MRGLIEIMDIALPVAYALTCALYLARFWKNSDALAAARWSLLATLGAHISYFVILGLDYGYVPLSGKGEFLSLAALAVALVYSFIEIYLKQPKTGVFFTAIALIFVSLGAVFMTHDEKPSELLFQYPIYGVHVVFMIMGFAALAVGFIYSLMYLLLERQLKSRDLGVFFKRLPPLMQLERMGKVGTVSGAVLLGFGITLGYLVGLVVVENVDFWDPKLLISNVVLAGYIVGILAVRFRGFSGVQTAYATMLWFVVFLASVGIASHPFS